ncbi:hypothetical protein TNCT_238671 [Trichonephila clavata]|uniref:Uncharacterized protein n=1 Tax=Trichonephila clavata TaxID=2740835 RepID=A0A8X6I5N8_TRICU|nr:hypothetical protein TNCT_238671 [Trichonephila clavata]
MGSRTRGQPRLPSLDSINTDFKTATGDKENCMENILEKAKAHQLRLRGYDDEYLNSVFQVEISAIDNFSIWIISVSKGMAKLLDARAALTIAVKVDDLHIETLTAFTMLFFATRRRDTRSFQYVVE